MGRYYDMVKANYNKLRNDEGVMWNSIEMWDKHLEAMREHHPDKYWEIMRTTHELMYGKHFDKMYAEWEVAQMHHTDDSGKVHKGEHWSLDQTNGVFSKYRSKIPSEYNEYDFYVALNAHYHDTVCVASRHFGSEDAVSAYIIDEAVAVWLMDEDWPHPDKVWVYFSAKNK